MENGADTEVVFKEDDHEREDKPETEVSAPPTPITHRDMNIIIRGWEEKFLKMMECLREVQMTSERASSDMCLVSQEARAQGQEHERRLADFLRKVENARIPTTPHVNALRASTPRICPKFGYNTSPVGRDEVSHPELNTLPHTRSARTEDQPDSMETHMGSARSTLPHIGSARTGDHDDAFGDTRNTLPHTSSARTEEQPMFRDTRTREHDDAFGDTRTREHSHDRNACSRDLQFRLDEQPTYEDDRRNSGDIQQSSYHPGNTSSFAR